MIRDALTVRPALTALILGTATALLVVSAIRVEPSAPRAEGPRPLCHQEPIATEPPPVRTRLQIEHLPPACQRYVLELDRFSLCEALPVESRDALSRAAGQMAQTWTTIPQDAWPSLSSACEQGLDALRQARQQLNCSR